MSTIFDVMERRLSAGSDGPMLADEGQRLSCTQLRVRVRALALELMNSGIRQGDRILIALPNSVDWVVATFAAMRIGAIAAPINPDAVEREIRSFEEVVQPRGVFAVGMSRGRFACQLLPLPVNVDDPGEAGLPQAPSSSDPALILFTSGTTGYPKAALLAHRVLVYAGEGLVHWLGLSRSDRVLACMPLFHANAIYYSLMGALCAGSDIFIAPRFSASGFWAAVRKVTATEVNLIGPMLTILLRQPPLSDDRIHGLRLVYTAAARQNDAEEFSRRFGVEVVEGYGLTETPYGCINDRGKPRKGSVGRPRRHPTGATSNEIRAAGENGAVLRDGEVGEIQIRNGATFERYWNNESATSAAFADGWLRTGDLGYRDSEGYFYIIGRAKDIVRRKGVNIAPVELELAMTEIHDIEEAVLVGLPSALGEELAIAVVTLKTGVPWDGAEQRILGELRKLVSREKLPDRVVITTVLPKTHTHRVEKSKLKAWLQREAIHCDPSERR